MPKNSCLTVQLFLIPFLIILVGCTPAPTPASYPTGLPPWEPKPTLLPTLVPLETLVADPNYMKGCLAINPTKYKKQADFMNIYPGVTPPYEIEILLGKADTVTNQSFSVEGEEAHSYKALKATIFIDVRTHVVDVIDIHPTNPPSLREIVKLYGCPDVIYAIDTNYELTGKYSATLLVYYRYAGISFSFDNLPIEEDAKPRYIYYFFPGLKFLENAYNLEPPTYAYLAGYLPITWYEAVR